MGTLSPNGLFRANTNPAVTTVETAKGTIRIGNK